MSKEKGGNLCNTKKNGTRDRDWLDCKQPGQRSHARRSFQKLSWEKSVFVSETFHAFSTYMFLRATNWFALWPFQDQIIRFGGDTDPSLPWPDHHSANNDTSMEKSLGSAMGSNAETLTLTPWNNRVWMELCIRPCRHHCIVRGNFRPKLTGCNGILQIHLSLPVLRVVQKTPPICIVQVHTALFACFLL